MDTHPMPAEKPPVRRFPVGAEPGAAGTSFRLWAPAHKAVAVVVEGLGELPLNPEPGGYFHAFVAGAVTGARYRFRLDGSETLYPDPVSRSQPDGPHGASEVIDAGAYRWKDRDWPGVSLPGQAIYEMHIGTFTPEATWRAAAAKLPSLKEIGITLIEMMPVAEFAGAFGWGYDGVALFAPYHHYGAPDDLRRFVDEAHRLGIGVILDVVYNHCGPDGCFLKEFTPGYFSKRYTTDWGEAINYDGPNAPGVREFVIANARYWIAEFHFDGLRLDATQNIYDCSAEHIIAALAREARSAAGAREIIIIAENEPQETKLVRSPKDGGYGLDGLWNDDFHHSALVALTGRNPAYYSDHRGHAQEFVSAAKYGYLFQGQFYSWQKKNRGTPAFDIDPWRFVLFIENHDQVANSARGARLSDLTSPAQLRAMTALLLLLPGTPMLFQGQEFGATSPFPFFADQRPEIADKVRSGRREFLSQFPAIGQSDMKDRLPDPGDTATFACAKLDWSERERNVEIVVLHRDLLRLRREDPVFQVQAPHALDGAVLGRDAFLIRFFGKTGDRLLIVNFGADLEVPSIADPLAAPPEGCAWRMLWSSEDPRYGGGGALEPDSPRGWKITGRSALVLADKPAK